MKPTIKTFCRNIENYGYSGHSASVSKYAPCMKEHENVSLRKNFVVELFHIIFRIVSDRRSDIDNRV